MFDTVRHRLNIVSSIPEWGLFVTSIRNLLIVAEVVFLTEEWEAAHTPDAQGHHYISTSPLPTPERVSRWVSGARCPAKRVGQRGDPALFEGAG